MPGYIQKLLLHLSHRSPRRPQRTPHPWTASAYGQKTQCAPASGDTAKLTKSTTKRLQSGTGGLLYYGHALDLTLLTALNEIGSSQTVPTTATNAKLSWLLNYAATHPNASIHYYKSDMLLQIDSDAAYLLLPHARSRFAGHFYLSDLPPTPPASPQPAPNGPIHTECRGIWTLVSSAAEAETTGVFHNGHTAIII